ncbi:dCTP deaminase, partial [Campylobacter sp. CLAX-7218-21]|nr:dCTP deaminase [Campylobacter sp. CLAX-22107-21]MEE3695260.1 dCTP deaminase [Campylobacter sp. CLAX-22107-21]MEE3712934.1 dCTP deaminase [Campylobacter sp. CLAX-7218-21]MEE3712946.1 dCTP deaminase [Campylobacter sp. CLAX-7218-21]
MGLKSDKWIRQMSLEHKMITPFCEENIGRGVV